MILCEIFASISLDVISEGRRDIILVCVSQRRNREGEQLDSITEYELMRKGMVKFLSKFQGRGIKITRVNSVRFFKPLIFDNILPGIAP